jgi:hypothetical protein
MVIRSPAQAARIRKPSRRPFVDRGGVAAEARSVAHEMEIGINDGVGR